MKPRRRRGGREGFLLGGAKPGESPDSGFWKYSMYLEEGEWEALDAISRAIRTGKLRSDEAGPSDGSGS